MRQFFLLSMLCLLAISAMAGPGLRKDSYFKIKVVDDRTGRGVPLVELTTVNSLHYVTDSNGIVAFHEPGLMGQSVFFTVSSHGYEFPKDGFGCRGVALKTEEGGSAEIKIHRINIAERLYRVTGEGIYADSLLVGEKVPIRHPLLNGGILGQDSVVNALYHGKLYWFWGDTQQVAYPLGDFNAPGATSRLPKDGGLDPETGVDLDYLNVGKGGFVIGSASMPGDGPTWLGGLVVLKGKDGRERMFAHYVKIRQPMTIYAQGLVEFDDAKGCFEKVRDLDMALPATPGGASFLSKDTDSERAYFGNPVPLFRVTADPESLLDPSTYEAFTCLKPRCRLDKPELDRAPDGRLRWGWKKDAPSLSPKDEAALLKPGEGLHQFRDIETGKPVQVHSGSVRWNPWRRRWVAIVEQTWGDSSMLGEIWYAEADTPLGPWVYARKIVTHEKYSFYNVLHHVEFDRAEGREIFFEGTYTTFLCPGTLPTPRYDYNQIMYKLDLADDRLNLPVPVYRLEGGKLSPGVPAGVSELPPIAFFALDREKPGTMKVPGVEPPCWGLPGDAKDASETEPFAGCIVWKNPLSVRLPVP